MNSCPQLFLNSMYCANILHPLDQQDIDYNNTVSIGVSNSATIPKPYFSGSYLNYLINFLEGWLFLALQKKEFLHRAT